jgi:signal transduction histidine kinase
MLREHGGTLGVRVESSGGTTFTLVFPPAREPR